MINWYQIYLLLISKGMSINSNVHEDCLKAFEDIKFNKKYRYIVYKVDSEKVVLHHLSRLLIQLEIRKKIGLALSLDFLIINPECVSSIWSFKVMMVWTAASYSSSTGSLMEHLLSRNFPMQHSRKASRQN